jgi:predicted protein tyrosine phosphatase
MAQPPTSFLDLAISGIDDVEALAGKPFTRVISISDAELKAERGDEKKLRTLFPGARFSFSYFDDVEFARSDGPDRAAVYRILLFSQGFTLADKILVQCRAGISRSTAIACAIACQHAPPGEEKAAVQHVRKIRPQMLPNFHIIRLADEILQRQGRLIAAIAKSRGSL